MSKQIILGVQITNRIHSAPELQKVLTEYGCNIKTRLGLHEVGDSHCSTIGLLLLEMYGEESAILEMEAKMNQFEGVNVQKMVFDQ
jgi:hypothetical protein